MEGTVTISIKDFDILRENANKFSLIQELVNDAYSDGTLKTSEIVSAFHKIAEVTIDY